MIIRCPKCAFTRQVSAGQIPDSAEFATCPKCKSRFRFRTVKERLPSSVAGEALVGQRPAIKTEESEEIGNDWSAPSSQPDKQPDSPEELPESEEFSQKGEQPLVESTADHQAEGDDDPSGRQEFGEKSERDIWAAMEDFNDERESGTKPQSAKPDQNREEPGEWAPWEEEPEAKQDRGSVFLEENLAERRRQAERAYREADGRPPFLADTGSVPWEYHGGFLTPQGFIRTVLLSFSRIPEFFGGVPLRGSIAPALIFALILRALQFTLVFAFMRIRVSGPGGGVLELSLLEYANIGVLELVVTSIFVILLMQFAIALLANIMVRLVNRGQADFRLTFKVVAYSLTPLIFVVLPAVGMLMAEIGTLVFFVLGLRHAYRLNWGRSLAVLVVPLGLLVLANFGMLSMAGM